MNVLRLEAAADTRLARAVVAVGNFDGVHRGHQALVARLVRAAADEGAPAVVLTFDPHPARVVGPGPAPAALMTLDQKAAALERQGADVLAVLPFTAEVAALLPERFAGDVLRGMLGGRAVVVGSNFRFGRGRAGDAATLRALGFEVIEVPPVLRGGGAISSSRIREAVGTGDVERAADLLGRRYFIEGTVVRGEGRGRTIGMPTANLEPRNETLPAVGVYAAWAWPSAHGPGVQAAVNVGRRPTFGGGAVSVEAHLMGFTGDLYDRDLALSFASRLRGEQRFPDAAALVEQVARDLEAARGALGAAAPASLWDAI